MKKTREQEAKNFCELIYELMKLYPELTAAQCAQIVCDTICIIKNR